MTARRGRALRAVAVLAVASASMTLSLQASAGAAATAQDEPVATTSTTIGVEIGEGVRVTRPADDATEVAGERASSPDGTAWWPWALAGSAVLALGLAISRRLRW